MFLWLAFGCDGGRARGGGPASPNSAGRDASSGDLDASPVEDRGPRAEDAGLVPSDAGMEALDARLNNPDAAPTLLDAASDAGVVVPDAGFASPDAGPVFPDAAVATDAGGADAGAAFQTDVSAVPGTSHANIAGGAPASFSVQLAYDNRGPNGETIRVTRASVGPGLPGVAFLEFAVGPDHFAPVGHSTENVASIPGSATGTIDPILLQLACSLGQVAITLELSNGDVVLEMTGISCAP